MSDVMPKTKTYILLSIIIMGINLSTFLVSCIINNSINIGSFVLSSGGSFVPFISLISIAISGLPVEIALLIGIITGILSGLQSFIVAMVLLQIIRNALWSPDV